MAKMFSNKKGFKVIAMNIEEAIAIWGQYGGCGICDNCNALGLEGYFVACLNRYYCEDCFKRWYKSAVRYPEDISFEKIQFNETVANLKRAGLWEQ